MHLSLLFQPKHLSVFYVLRFFTKEQIICAPSIINKFSDSKTLLEQTFVFGFFKDANQIVHEDLKAHKVHEYVHVCQKV
jgi:hypothetical protein